MPVCGFMDQQSTFEAVFNAPVTHPDQLTSRGGQCYGAIHRMCHIQAQCPAVRLTPCCYLGKGVKLQTRRFKICLQILIKPFTFLFNK